MIKKLMLVGIIATHCYAIDEAKQDDVGGITTRLAAQRLDAENKNSMPITEPKDPMITTYVNKENGKKITVYGEGL